MEMCWRIFGYVIWMVHVCRRLCCVWVVLRQWVIFCVGLGDIVFVSSVRVVLCEKVLLCVVCTV